MKDFSRTGIVVMDVGAPAFYADYRLEKETNDKFVEYLNSRLINLRNQGAKIIEINYSGTKHFNMNVNFDCSTTEKKELYQFIDDNNINQLIYTGFHYPICITHSRPLSAYKVVRNPKLDAVYIAIQLTRSTKGHYIMPLHQTENHGVQAVML